MRSVIVTFLVVFSGCAAATQATARRIPPALVAPADQVLLLEARARGAQIYQCRASETDATKFEWNLTGPQADLYDQTGTPIGRHYAGPTWELTDGSKVVAAVAAKDPGPDPSAISWLLLTAKSTAGTGLLNRTKSIQRLSTTGGRAPVDGCGREDVGKTVRVPYQASYCFYGAR